MRMRVRDGIASLLVRAIAMPYIGYLVRGSLPFLQDPRGMAATGLVLGLGVFVLAGQRAAGRLGRLELTGMVGALVLGAVALAFAKTTAAEALLAAFMVALALGLDGRNA